MSASVSEKLDNVNPKRFWIRFASEPCAADIIANVALRHDVTVSQLMGRKRYPEFVAARHEAMFRIRQELVWSFPKIGKLFGRRDHSTIMHAVNKLLGNGRARHGL